MNYKLTSITLISILSLLTACSPNEVSSHTPQLLSDENLVEVANIESREELFVLEDGLYFAEEADYSTDGWKNTVTLQVKDGKITDVHFNSITADATEFKRDLSEADLYIMDEEAQDQLKWHEQIKNIETYLINNQSFSSLNIDDTGKTDTISGVSITVSPFINLVQSALNNGVIEKGPYQDGHYYAEQSFFVNGIKYNINMLIENGYIIVAHWDAINEDGSSLKEMNPETEEQLAWVEQAKSLEDYLVSIQDPTLITYNDNNQTDTVSGVTIKVDQFIELAIQALASGPVID